MIVMDKLLHSNLLIGLEEQIEFKEYIIFVIEKLKKWTFQTKPNMTKVATLLLKKKKNVPEKILGIAASWHGTDLTYSSKVSQPLHHMSWIQNVPWDFTTSKTHWEIVQKETKRHMPNSCHRPF